MTDGNPLPELELWDVALRLGVAALLTGLVGLEREWRERAAGLRTHMLVGVGSALFTLVSAYAWSDFVFDRTQGTVFDPTRISAQIVTGIGFIGAGAIIRQGLSIRGLTTAAGLWVAAAIGMAVGAGYWAAALIGTGVVLVGLGPLRMAEGMVMKRRQTERGTLQIDLRPEQPLAPVLAVLEERRARVSRIHLEEEEEGRELRLEVRMPPGVSGRDLVEELTRLEEVTAVRWDE
jgi:putative Mg2+ transporter-C (MgtC) family protein